MSIVLFLIILAVLIFVHELGHFLAAKLSGVRVDEFAIGFPPKLFKFKYGETLYTINLIPFGGFVKIFGENPNEDSLRGPESNRSFINKNRLTQAIILCAGVFFNLVFAWLLITGALFSGLPASAQHVGKGEVVNPKVTIIEVLKDSPAERAQFQVGDRVLAAEAGAKKNTFAHSDELRAFIVNHGTEEIIFTVERKGTIISIHAVPESDVVKEKRAIGVALADIGMLKLTVSEALIEGSKNTYTTTIATAKGLYGFVRDAILGQADFKQVTGPIGIVSLVGDASDFGLAYLLTFTAFISINLAVINILPFPALDGGRLFVVLIESITRRRLNYTYVNTVNVVGFVLLMILMVLVTYQDILRLVTN